MAVPQVKLEYWNGSNWIEAKTHSGNTAVIICKLKKKLNNPSVCELFLANTSKDYSAAGEDKEDAKGLLTDTFTDFMDCRVSDLETGLFLFRGRVYDVRNQYDFQYGSTIKVILKDVLQELVDYPVDDAPPALRNIRVALGSGQSGDAGTDYFPSRGYVIQRLVQMLSADNFSFTDADKFESSVFHWTDKDVEGSKVDAAGNTYWSVSTGKRQALQLIHDFAMHDPHDAAAVSGHFGYDYYIDPSFESSATTHRPAVDFNYYKRLTRPSISQVTGSSNPAAYGLTVEYPSAGWGGETPARRAMLQDAEFSSPKDNLYSSVVVHFEDTGGADPSAEGGDSKPIKHGKGVSTFEILDGTTVGFAEELWEGKLIQLFIGEKGTINASTGEGTTEGHGIDQSKDEENPFLIYASGQVKPCATLHYHSGNGANEFIIVSNIYSVDTDYEDASGKIHQFLAFPTGTSSTRFHLKRSQSSSSTATAYIDIIPDTARTSRRYGINRPLRVQSRSMDTYDRLRKEMAAKLDRVAKKTITNASIRCTRYPYTKLIAPSANANRSGNSNVINFINANGRDAFAPRNVTTGAEDLTSDTNDCRKFGAMEGMVVAELDGSSVINYAYISTITPSSVTYGSSASDTNNGNAIPLDEDNDIAIFVPVEPGHAIRVKNNVWGMDYDILVQEFEFTVQPGVIMTTIKGVGVNENSAGVGGLSPNDVQSSVSGVSDQGFTVNLPRSQQPWFISDGAIEVHDYNSIKVTPSIASETFVTVNMADGSRYFMDKTTGNHLDIGGTGNSVGQPHVLYLRPSGYGATSVVADSASKTLQAAPSVVLSSGSPTHKTYQQIRQDGDILIGWATADTDTSADGMATLKLNGAGSFGDAGIVSLAEIGNNRVTTALLKRGAKPFTSDLVIEPVASDVTGLEGFPEGANAFRHIKWHGAASDTANATLRWGQGANANREDDPEETHIIAYGGNPTTESTANNYLYTANGSAYTYKTTLQLVANTANTLYMFLDLADETYSTGILRFTDLATMPFNDDKILLGMVVIAANNIENTETNNSGNNTPETTTGRGPTIIPFGSKIISINAQAIAANSITADSIAAGSITAREIDAGTITADNIKANEITSRLSDDLTGITINNTNDGQIFTAGKDTFASNTVGWLLEANGGAPRLDITGSTSHLRYDASSGLIIKGSVTIGTDGPELTNLDSFNTAVNTGVNISGATTFSSGWRSTDNSEAARLFSASITTDPYYTANIVAAISGTPVANDIFINIVNQDMWRFNGTDWIRANEKLRVEALSRVYSYAQDAVPTNQNVSLFQTERKDAGNLWVNTTDDPPHKMYRLQQVGILSSATGTSTGSAPDYDDIIYVDNNTTNLISYNAAAATAIPYDNLLFIDEEDMEVRQTSTSTVYVERGHHSTGIVNHAVDTPVYGWVDVGVTAPAASVQTQVFTGDKTTSAAINTQADVDSATLRTGDLYISTASSIDGDVFKYDATEENDNINWTKVSDTGSLLVTAQGEITGLDTDVTTLQTGAAHYTGYFETDDATPADAVKAGDILYDTTTQKLYIANAAGIGSPSNILPNSVWRERSDALAINNAKTAIKGGLIETQRIELKKGGVRNRGLKSMEDVKLDTGRNLDEAIDENDTVFDIEAKGGVDLTISVGDVIAVEDEDMLVEAASNTSLTVVRGYNNSTAVAHSDDEDIYKYTPVFVDTGRNLTAYLSVTATVVTVEIEALGGGDLSIVAGDILRLGAYSYDEYVYVISVSDNTFTVERGYMGTENQYAAEGHSVYKAKFTDTGEISGTHIIMDNYGITGFSDAYTPEFTIRASDGKAIFGGNAGKIDSGGVTLASTGDYQDTYTFVDAGVNVNDPGGIAAPGGVDDLHWDIDALSGSIQIGDIVRVDSEQMVVTGITYDGGSPSNTDRLHFEEQFPNGNGETTRGYNNTSKESHDDGEDVFVRINLGASNDINTLRLNWDSSSLGTALSGLAYASLGGWYEDKTTALAGGATGLDVDNFHMIWYTHDNWYSQYTDQYHMLAIHDFNRGAIANIGAIGSRTHLDPNYETKRQFYEFPRQTSVVLDYTPTTDYLKRHPVYEPTVVIAQRYTETDPVSPRTGLADDPWILKSVRKTAAGAYVGNGATGGAEIDTGIKSLQMVMLWEQKLEEHDNTDWHIPSYAAENNRQSQEGDHGIMICLYGSNPVVDGADEGTDLSGETSRGIFEPKSNKWFGGRGEILHASGDLGKFRVYAEGHSTTWSGDDYTFNVQGRLYYWAAFG